MKISQLNYNSNTYLANKINPASQYAQIPFGNTIHDIFTPSPIPKVEVLSGVNKDYAKNVQKEIKTFSQKWLNEFKKNNYKIIIARSFKDGYTSQKVYDPMIAIFEKQNPAGTLGVTYTEGDLSKNFFVFCDKPPYSNKYMKNIITHELSHGVVNIKKLDENPCVRNLIKQDIQEAIDKRKFDKMKMEELEMIFHYFFNKNSYLPVDEIIADTYAWTIQKGCYGSGLVMDVNNPKLILNLFPNLAAYLKTI